MIEEPAAQPTYQDPAPKSREFDDMRRKSADTDLQTRLATLFAHMRSLRSGEQTSDENGPQRAAALVDEARLQSLFSQLAGPLDQARRAGHLSDVWDMAGLGRNKVRTGAALAALWNPRLCGTIAVEFLSAFIARLDPHENLPTRADLAAGYTVRTEDRPLGRADERVDIVIDGATFLLGIEIKIDAPEGEAQLSAYRNALQARAMHRRQRPSLIYLSPKPPVDSFVGHAGWADLADAAREIVQRHATWRDVSLAARAAVPPQPDGRPFVHQLIAQFAAYVASF